MLPFPGKAEKCGFVGSAHHHGLSRSEMWQQLVFLHDVAGHFPECPQVPGFSIDQDLALHSSLPGRTNRRPTCRSHPDIFKPPCEIIPDHNHLYPARMFIKVDFPDPDGPMIPISSRLQNLPDRHFSKALNPGDDAENVHNALKHKLQETTTLANACPHLSSSSKGLPGWCRKGP